jgi:hypothetical protein
MATTYSNYTGGSNSSAAIYTVPAGKVAKLIITDLNINSNQAIQIGSYRKDNKSADPLYTRFSSTDSPTTSQVYLETEDIIVPRRNVASLAVECMPMKRSHILVAGQDIKFLASDSFNTVSFTVIEEDV